MTAPCEYAAEAGGRLVINQAGLSGHYEFDLEFLPDDVRGNSDAGGRWRGVGRFYLHFDSAGRAEVGCAEASVGHDRGGSGGEDGHGELNRLTAGCGQDGPPRF